MKSMNRFLKSLALVTVLLMSASLCFAAPKGKVIVFHAGSLTVPFDKIEKDFEALHPDIDILREAGGSTKMARMISEVGKKADIMASADYKVIDNTLVPDFADWNVRFASNQLVLCYTPTSRFSDTITSDNWYDILLKEDVVWGHSDPNLDPCGYRSLMVLKLAEKFYSIDGLYDKLIANRPLKNVRPKSVELVNLLKTGNMDYAWEYRSVAVQHGLKYITLDDHINLGNYKYDAFYRQATVEVTGKKPGTFTTKTGQSCTYGITMIKNSPNPEAAELFLSYLLSADGGLKTLESMGQPPFIPCRVPSQEMKEALPGTLVPLVEIKE
ncbi:putative sulfate transport system, substrate-binding protein [Desulforapulum autotrophicum HRM2]|uniref:Sulfate transport system, substrate-binding protein n=1 Tax=Desulforapulum autotrophicum (strain ATCC 43914 / DSM 3382 / VKM B-1955 / HRM2) TaxID=177437 RepID=C0QLN1_DESAH|nr:tungstate ABC transporter substrate-binding protein WtpA [Desulforapulum autotrophicum]ACN16335.1 putative sulfate transport system, substrate-binding protein [Desulforapulum autotrophicum HRM2]